MAKDSITNSISLYNRIDKLESKEDIPFDLFIKRIQDGYWQDIVIPIRAIADKKTRDAEKKKAPYVTISGKFETRTDAGLQRHSGLIGIDIDEVANVEELKNTLKQDKYIVAAFQSISGRGLCVVFSINPTKHREAFEGIGEYLYRNYKVVIDPTSINVSRPRFVSFDPGAFITENHIKFAEYPAEKAPKKIEKYVYSGDDFSQIMKQIEEGQLNITQDSYHVWLRICFALVHKFGEAGRDYFHRISRFSAKYDPKMSDKQFNACLRHRPTGKEATIAMFYHYAKESGVDLYTERTRMIIRAAANARKSGLTAEQVADNLERVAGITDAKDIIEQVIQGDIQLTDESPIEQIKSYLQHTYEFERNEITRFLEMDGRAVRDIELNSIWVKAKAIFPTLPFDTLMRILYSDFTTLYNPFERYFSELKLRPAYTTIPPVDGKEPPTPLTTALFNSIQTTDPDYLLYFGKKWLVSIISAMHGIHSPLMLVLTGKQGTGKTEWFRRLLPEALNKKGRNAYPKYFAESKLDREKDDEILMTQKIIVMDDEMGGKSKKDDLRIKEITSKETFTLREPYGHINVELHRLAVLCGTTNNSGILSDDENRRIIPIDVLSIDYHAYNRIDKDDLWLEIYNLYMSGFDWQVGSKDIAYLNKNDNDFRVISPEAELIMKYFKEGNEEELTATEIKVYIEERTKQHLSVDKIGKELKRLGYARKTSRAGNAYKKVYEISFKNKGQFDGVPGPYTTGVHDKFIPPTHPDDDLPF